MEPRPHGDPLLPQPVGHPTRVPPGHAEGENAPLAALFPRPVDLHPGHPAQTLGRLTDERRLMAEQGRMPRRRRNRSPSQQTRRPGDVVGARLQPVRQKIRHIGLPGQAPGPPARRGSPNSRHSSRPVPWGP